MGLQRVINDLATEQMQCPWAAGMQDNGGVPVEVVREGFWDGFKREQSAWQEGVGALEV